MTRISCVSSLFGGVLLLACGAGATPPVGDDGTTTTTTTGAGEAGYEETGVPVTGSSSGPGGSTSAATTGAGVGDSSSGAGSDTTDAGDDCECNFICDRESEGYALGAPTCDVFEQDCLSCEKCAPSGGGWWNDTRCVPLTGEGAPGEPCTVEGSATSGRDDCRKGAVCWDVDAEGKGVCVELRGGHPDAPTCSNEADFSCADLNYDVLHLCLPACDPLMQDCPGDDLCLPFITGFVCVRDGSDEAGKTFEPCEYIDACDEGLLCLDSSLGIECDPNATGCCLPVCDVADVDATCPGAGQKCVALYGEGQSASEYANVGVCIVLE